MRTSLPEPAPVRQNQPVDTLNAFQQKVMEKVASYGAIMPQLLLAGAVLVLWYFSAGVIRRGVRRAVQKVSGDEGSSRVVARLVRSAYLFLGILVAGSIAFPGFSFSALITTLGLGSVAIGFAFKDIIENFLAGLILLVSRPFRIGDVVEIQARRGTIVTIETRTTSLRMFDGEYVIIPNAILIKEPIVVVSRQPVRRFDVRIAAEYRGDLAHIRQLTEEAIAAVQGVSAEPAPQIYFDNFREAGVEFRVFWWVDTLENDALQVKNDIIVGIQGAFAREGIDVPNSMNALVRAASGVKP